VLGSNHDDVTSWWSGPLESHIVVVGGWRAGWQCARWSGRCDSHRGEQAGQRAGDPGEVEGRGGDGAGTGLPAGAGAHEAAQLPVAGGAAVGGLPGEGQERAALALRLDQLLDPAGAQRADHLVLQVRDADEVGTDPVQAAPEIMLLALVAQ